MAGMEDEEIRVLQYVKVLDRGGLESFILNYAQYLQKYNIYFDYLVTRDCCEPYEDAIRELGGHKIIVEIDNNNRIKKGIQEYFKFYKYFSDCGYNIIHFESISPSIQGNLVLLAAKVAGIKKRIVHSHIAREGYQNYKGLKNIIYKITKHNNCKWGTNFWACSGIAAEFAFTDKVIQSSKYALIKNAIDTNRFKYNQDSRLNIRKIYNHTNKYIIGVVARFVNQKNHLFALDIIEHLIKIDSKYVLWFIGEKSDDEPEVLDLVKETIKKKKLEKNVLFVGGVKNVNEYYSAMDYFLQPSFFEGLPVSLIEAQASGLKCIVSDNISSEAFVTNNVIPLNLSSGSYEWAKCINSFLNYEREDCSQKMIEAGYDIENNAQKLAKLYRGLNNYEGKNITE